MCTYVYVYVYIYPYIYNMSKYLYSCVIIWGSDFELALPPSPLQIAFWPHHRLDHDDSLRRATETKRQRWSVPGGINFTYNSFIFVSGPGGLTDEMDCCKQHLCFLMSLLLNFICQKSWVLDAATLFVRFLTGRCSRGGGNWGTQRPKDSQGRLGNLRERKHHPPLRILLCLVGPSQTAVVE